MAELQLDPKKTALVLIMPLYLCLFHQRHPMRLHLLGILIYQRERDGLFIRKG